MANTKANQTGNATASQPLPIQITSVPKPSSLLQRLIARAAGIDKINQQLSQMQSEFNGLQQNNAALQADNTALAARAMQMQNILAINFRNAGGFARFNNIQVTGLINDGYAASAAIYSIVSRIAQLAASVPMRVYEVKDSNALKQYKALKDMPRTLENTFRLFQLKQRALVEVPEDNPLQNLIDYPNPMDSKQLFYQTLIAYRLVTGNAFWSMPTLDFGVNAGLVNEMYIMPSQYMGIITTNGWPNPVLGYELIVSGLMLYKGNEVIHTRYPNLSYSIDGLQLYGMSPLYAGRKTAASNNNAETAADFMFINGGPRVIIARKDWDGSERSTEQIGQTKMADKREYSGITNVNKLKVMAGDIDVHSVGLSPVDLDIIASQNFTFDMLCNLFHISSIMFNNKGASTESNVKEMRRDSWTAAIIPEIQAIADGYNLKLVPLYSKKFKKKYFIDLDITGIPELQPDMATMTTWLAAAYWVTPNEKREYQDFARDPDPNMDKYYFPNNVVPLEDVSIPVEEMEQQQGIQDDNLDNSQNA